MKKIILMLALVCFGLASNLKTLLEDTYANNQESIIDYYEKDYNEFCERYHLISNNKENIRNYHFLKFLHELFTNTSASNFNVSGILKIPYFWHWGAPQDWEYLDRHNIILNSTSESLINVKPLQSPRVYRNYKSYSYMDRRPELFLSDLFSANPKYSHSKIGNFYSFGWCSEKEPAFSSVLSVFDYKVKVYTSDIHSITKVLTTFIDGEFDVLFFDISIDNTFDDFSIIITKKEYKEWKEDIGESVDSEKYDSWITGTVESISISKETINRLDRLVKEYYE